MAIISELTTRDFVKYLKLEDLDEDEIRELEHIIAAAKSYIKNYTGQENLDKHEDLTIALYVLVQDLYDNRFLQTDKSLNVNRTVTTILDMHSINLI